MELSKRLDYSIRDILQERREPFANPRARIGYHQMQVDESTINNKKLLSSGKSAEQLLQLRI